MTQVLAPCAGQVLPAAQIPDQVFAQEILGASLGIDPVRTSQTVIAPISGKLLKVHAHAVAILAGTTAVLVHLGIDTVKHKDLFDLHVTQGDLVEAGDRLVTWDPRDVDALGLSPVVVVIAMERKKGSVEMPSTGPVEPGQPLFALD